MAKKDRLPLSSNAPTHLAAPFAGLQMEGLPAGEAAPVAAQIKPARPRLGRVVLRRETAHRGGRTVIVVHDFAPSLPLSLIEDLARKLRNACGCGGTTRQRAIELQGDQPAKIRAFLEQEGFQVAGVK